MENIIAVFNNRNLAMRFASDLKRLGVQSKIINTPRELSVSCGISVAFSSRNLGQGKLLLGKIGYGGVKLYIATKDMFRKFHQIN